MEKRRCAACCKLFHPCPQSPKQKFCSAAECQRERKRRWQKARRAADSDYRDNDVRANRQWRRRHPDYWRDYRRHHPQRVIRNREKQRERDRVRRLKASQPPPGPDLANEDASSLPFSVETGTYRMIPVTGGDLANEHACLVKIALVSGG
ncbi:MAG: hypothetical protein ABFS45_21635 [Pseudomonadota bacterium]